MEFKDKFIAFIDVLGFKSMIESAERGEGRTLPEIRDILTALGGEKDAAFYRQHGPKTCPQSACLQKGFDFQVAQVSDCAIISSEVSPAGVVHIINHCWAAAMVLLQKGVMVRGYITRGRIYHDGVEFMGTGYHEAYNREGGVSVFKREADERGTPFIEVDPKVSTYVRDETDACVREMFSRYVKTDGDLTALFPFKRLAHSFIIAGLGAAPFNAEKEKRSNNNLRETIHKLKQRVLTYVDKDNERAMAKAGHYIAALDEQLAVCDRTDQMIDRLTQPIGRPL
jgi:hypothetical protein